MLYRKSLLSSFRFFLKSINKLWVIPLLLINVIIPVLSFMFFKNMKENAEPYIMGLMFLILPVSAVWTSVFVSEMFFSDKSKDILFFYSIRKRVFVSSLFFLISAINSFVIVLLHSYCLYDSFGMAVKILSVSVLFYGIAILVLRLSKSSTMSLLILILYSLVNEFTYSEFFLFYKTYDELTGDVYLFQYLPLSLIGMLLAALAFSKKIC